MAKSKVVDEILWLTWVDNRDITIKFSRSPRPISRYITPTTDKMDIAVIQRYPFINTAVVGCEISDHRKGTSYRFIVPRWYSWDGMTIPSFVWPLIGLTPTSPQGMICSMIHDYICEHKDVVEHNRRISTLAFRELLMVGGVNKFKAYVMSFFVDVYQKYFCRW